MSLQSLSPERKPSGGGGGGGRDWNTFNSLIGLNAHEAPYQHMPPRASSQSLSKVLQSYQNKT